MNSPFPPSIIPIRFKANTKDVLNAISMVISF